MGGGGGLDAIKMTKVHVVIFMGLVLSLRNNCLLVWGLFFPYISK